MQMTLPLETGLSSVDQEAEHLAWLRGRLKAIAPSGGKARAAKMTRAQRRAAARHASRIRWAIYRAVRGGKRA
jgi:hypothetical protein